MNGVNVTITDMMNCRDRRVSIQNELIGKYNQPVLSFCMNIPGPVKTNEQIRKAIDEEIEAEYNILKALSDHNITILHTEEFHEPSGDELIMTLNAPAEDIKTLATEIEESHPLGRLFDMDVIGTDGMKLSRGTYRKCIICGCQAQECARSRKHSVEELQAKIEELLNQFAV